MTYSILEGKKILLGLTGGIACYKVAELTRLLTKQGAEVQVVMTEGAKEFITPTTLQALSNKPVYHTPWDASFDNHMPHISLSRWADAIVIAPCSTHFMAKLAQGLCDDLLSLICISRPADTPLYLAPAMNVEMWLNPATQRNKERLIQDGLMFFGPACGEQACGDVGLGRMLEAQELWIEIEAAFTPKLLKGKKVLITAGPTFEAIDPVRGITNLSSGKMGYAIAQAAYYAGAEVTLISGPTGLNSPYGIQRIQLQSAQEMYDAVMTQAPHSHIFMSVAAVADWKVENTSQQKIKKEVGKAIPPLQFSENPDILASVAKLPKSQRPYCVGFAAETENLIAYASQKRIKKNVPLLVGNVGPNAFGQDENELILFDEKGHQTLRTHQGQTRASKTELAQVLIEEIAKRI